jgi:hypothetical protein
MTRAEIVFPGVLLIAAVALLTGGWLAGYSWAVLMFPFSVGVLLCVLCALQIATVLAGRSSVVAEAEPLEPLTIPSVGWVFALPVFLYALGFVVGPAAYLLAYLRANGTSWAGATIIAASSVLVTWVVFIKLMRILLPIEPIWMF